MLGLYEDEAPRERSPFKRARDNSPKKQRVTVAGPMIKTPNKTSGRSSSVLLEKLRYEFSPEQVEFKEYKSGLFDQHSSLKFNDQGQAELDQQPIDLLEKEKQEEADAKRVLGNMKSHASMESILKKSNVDDGLKLKKNFGLLEGEILFDSFCCAYRKSYLMQGRLYVTNRRLLFYFKLINETCLSIPYNEISIVTKKLGALVFPNSIEICTTKRVSLFLTSFVSRDKAYDLIQKVLGFWKAKAEIVVQDEIDQIPVKFRPSSISDNGKHPLLLSLDAVDKERLNNLKDYQPCPTTLYSATFQNTPIQAIYYALVNDKPNAYFDQTFLREWHSTNNERDIEEGPFTPTNNPAYFYEFRDLRDYLMKMNDKSLEESVAEWPGDAHKVITYVHTIKGIPFAPKECVTEQRNRYIWLSPNRFKIINSHYTFKVPYCDYFFTKFEWDVEQTVKIEDIEDGDEEKEEENSEIPKLSYSCKVNYTYDVVMVKSTIFKNKIITQATKEVKKYEQPIKEVFERRLKQARELLESMSQEEGDEETEELKQIRAMKENEHLMKREIEQLRREIKGQRENAQEREVESRKQMMRLGVGIVVALVLFELIKFLLL